MLLRSSLALAVALVVLTLNAACGDGEHSVTGVILDVNASSLTELESFTLRTTDGETLVFSPAPDASHDPEEGLFPGHMQSHALAVEQVRVFYREEGGRLLATRIAHD